MILPNNGYLEIEQTKGGGLVDGIPQQGEVSFSNKIPCHLLKNTEDKKGNYKDGKFIRISFTAWIDNDQDFKAQRVRITDNLGDIKGVFEVQSIEVLNLVNRIKITF